MLRRQWRSVSRQTDRASISPTAQTEQVAKQDKRGIRDSGNERPDDNVRKMLHAHTWDAIVGLITRGRGVTVHRTDCPNIGQISEEPERILQVNWDMENDQAFTVQLRVRSHDRKFLLSDISTRDSGCNIQSATDAPSVRSPSRISGSM